MKFLSLALFCITLSLMVGTYIGNRGIDTGVYMTRRAYELGCGLGVAKSFDFTLDTGRFMGYASYCNEQADLYQRTLDFNMGEK
jgi:hypothetical protein